MGNVAKHEPITVLGSAARTSNSNGQPADMPRDCDAVLMVLDVSAAATDATDTLDVVVQAWLGGVVDSTEEWVDVLAFDQVLGNGGKKTYVYKLINTAALTGFETGSALSAGNKRDVVAKFRAKWTIVDSGNGDQSFTFSVTAIPM